MIFELLRLLLPLVSVVLFLYACGAGVMRFARQTPETEKQVVDRRAAFLAGDLCFLVCAACAALLAVFSILQNPGMTLEAALQQMAAQNNTDTRHYMDLAKFGYGNGEKFAEQYLMIVFYPLFPWLVRGIHLITGSTGCYYIIGMLLQPFLAGAGGGLLYALMQRRFGKITAGWALLFAAAMPGSFFYAMPMTESLYLVLAAAAFLALDLDEPLWFAAAGCLAAMTRSVGLLLAGVAGILWLQKLRAGDGFRKSFRWLAACAGPTAGFLSYLGLNWYCYGNCFAFSYYDENHWSQQLGFFFKTIYVQMGDFWEWWGWNQPEYAILISAVDVVCILFALGMVAAVCRKLPLPWLGYSLVYIAVAYGVTKLLSAPRYMLSLLFIPLCLSLSLPRRWQKVLFLGLEICISAVYFQQFLVGRPIC